MSKYVIPRFKLILFYDVLPDRSEEYQQFVTTELVPMIQSMGLYMFRVFHTSWGDCPMRQAEFVAENLETVHLMFADGQWQALEERLQHYVTNYQRKLVRFRPGFQF